MYILLVKALLLDDEEENLYQLVRAWSSDNKDIECYLKANKSTSYNDLIEILGITLLRKLLLHLRKVLDQHGFLLEQMKPLMLTTQSK